MNWAPFVVGGESEKILSPRGISTPEGIGDRLRTAAFAEFQAREAFRWAAKNLPDASEELRAVWVKMADDEDRHFSMILKRMVELGVAPDARPVSDRLWNSLINTRGAAEFSEYMRTAEERGRAAEESFAAQLAKSDPATAAMFAEIAVDEEKHISLAANALKAVVIGCLLIFGWAKSSADPFDGALTPPPNEPAAAP